MSGEGTYAPKSPDLSSLFAGPATAGANNDPGAQDYYNQSQAQGYQLQGRPTQQQGLHLQPPPPQNYYQQPPLSPSARFGSGGHPQPHQHQSLDDPYSPRRQAQQQPPPLQQYYTPTSPQQVTHQPQPAFGLQSQQPYYQAPYADQSYPYSAPAQSYSQPQQYYNPLAAVQTPLLQPPADLQPHQEQHQQQQHLQQQQQQADTSAMPPRRAAAPQPPVIEPSPVKTKFPTARIKRIMQADEEVGKVAQQTPIAVGKALELFMIALVTKSADVAKEKNSKRVTAQMLKHVVESDDQWDFLRDIVGRVENEDKAKSGSRAKAESSSDEEPVETKKKVKGGRKKKA